uniref:Major facilitator superfamily (MFS) profile domain-containing protein n=2 Tax=Parascaris univalens TaxID=6257 RepID=A0A915CKM4_PARUN
MLLLSTGALFAYANSSDNVVINCMLMVVTGFFVGGPANLISSAVSADLGRVEQVRGSAEALSTVTGIIDGTGSVGASIGQLLLPVVQHAFGWVAVFYGFIIMMLCTFTCLTPLLWKEMMERRRYRYNVLRSDRNSSAQLIDAEQEGRFGSHEELLGDETADSNLVRQTLSDVTETHRHRRMNAEDN